MSVIHSTIELPVANTKADASSLLREYATTPLPAVIIRNLGASTVHEAVGQIASLLPEGMSTKPTSRDYDFGSKMGNLKPPGLHRDHYPPRPNATELPITYHFTTGGLAVASFLKAGPGFMQNHLEATSVDEVALRLSKLLAVGMVDTDLAEAIRYQTTIEPGTLAIFKNGLPLWHLFEGNDERLSTAFDSTIAITPDMGVQYYDGPLPSFENSWDAPL
jgi:hypothetical protein